METQLDVCSSIKTQKKWREGGNWWAHPPKPWGRCGSDLRDREMKGSSALFLCVTPVHRHCSLSLGFPENTTLAPPGSHLHNLGIRKNRPFPSGSRKRCQFLWCKFFHPGQRRATTLRSLNGEGRRAVHGWLSWAWLSRCEQVQARSSTALSILHPPCPPTKTWIIPDLCFQAMLQRRQRRKPISTPGGNCYNTGTGRAGPKCVGVGGRLWSPLPGLELGPLRRLHRDRCLYAPKRVHQTHKCGGGRACRGNTLHKDPQECSWSGWGWKELREWLEGRSEKLRDTCQAWSWAGHGSWGPRMPSKKFGFLSYQPGAFILFVVAGTLLLWKRHVWSQFIKQINILCH